MRIVFTQFVVNEDTQDNSKWRNIWSNIWERLQMNFDIGSEQVEQFIYEQSSMKYILWKQKHWPSLDHQSEHWNSQPRLISWLFPLIPMISRSLSQTTGWSSGTKKKYPIIAKYSYTSDKIQCFYFNLHDFSILTILFRSLLRAKIKFVRQVDEIILCTFRVQNKLII